MEKLLIEGDYYIPVQKSLARAVGGKKAAILQQIYYWMKTFEESDDPSVRKNHFHDGRWWVYNTFAEWEEEFKGIMGGRKMQDYFWELEESGLLISATYNKVSYDRTKWYSVDVDKVRSLVNSHFAESAKCISQKVQDGFRGECDDNTKEYSNNTYKEEILVHDSEKPTVKPTDKESWDSEPLYNKRYGIPINLGEMSDEETDIWYEAIDYFIEKHKQWSIKPHRKHNPDYWRRYTIETSIKICLRGFTVTTELVHRIIDYYFDIEHPRGDGEWSMMCSDKNMNGILVKLFGGSRSDRESAGMLEPKEVWEYSFARERELDLV